MTDKVIFTTTRLGGEKKMLVIANQRAETSIEDDQVYMIYIFLCSISMSHRKTAINDHY